MKLAGILLLANLVLCSKALALSADSYLDFKLSTYLVPDGQEVTVRFTYDIKGLEMKDQRRLTIRPYLSAGSAEIYNPLLERFVNQADNALNFPYLQEEMSLKFRGLVRSQVPAQLHFVITDTITGTSYLTPSRKVWGTAYYEKYREILTENLGPVSAVSTPTNIVPAPQFSDPVRLKLWYLSPAFFLLGLLKSPHGYG